MGEKPLEPETLLPRDAKRGRGRSQVAGLTLVGEAYVVTASCRRICGQSGDAWQQKEGAPPASEPGWASGATVHLWLREPQEGTGWTGPGHRPDLAGIKGELHRAYGEARPTMLSASPDLGQKEPYWECQGSCAKVRPARCNARAPLLEQEGLSQTMS